MTKQVKDDTSRAVVGPRRPGPGARNRTGAPRALPVHPVAGPRGPRGSRAARSFYSGTASSAWPWTCLESLIEATCTRQRDRLLARANLGIEKLRFLFRLAWDLQYLDARRYEFAARTLDETGRKIGAWRKTHREQKAPEPV